MVVCILKIRPTTKGKYGVVEKEKPNGVVVIYGNNKQTFERDEVCTIGDKVQFSVDNGEEGDESEFLVGTIKDIQEIKSGLDFGYAKVNIYVDSGEAYTVNGRRIFSLVKKKEDEEEEQSDEQTTPCLTLNFLAELLTPNGEKKSIYSMFSTDKWFYPEYLLKERLQYLISRLQDGTIVLRDDTFYWLSDSYKSLIELDKKMFQLLILKMKNHPKYFKEDGYKYYFYDELHTYINSAIANNKASIIDPVDMVAISDNEVMVQYGEVHIVSIDNEAKQIKIKGREEDDKFFFLNLILNFAKENNLKFGEPVKLINNMKGFVKMINMAD